MKTDPKVLIDLAQWLTTIGVALYVWASNRHRATRDQIEEVRKTHDHRLDNHAERLTRSEEQLRHLPTVSALTELAERVGELHGDLKALSAKFEGWQEVANMMRRQIELMDEFLRKAK